MGDACRKFDTPVTGGNVSFYNQNPEGPVNPTPTIGMVGLLEDINKKMTLDFKQEGDVIYILGAQKDDINSSEYLYHIHGVKKSPAPYFNLDEEYALQQAVLKLISEGLIRSAHDVSEGGLFVTLCESGFHRALGFDIKSNSNLRKDAFLFGEAQSRVVVSVEADKIKAFEAALPTDVPFAQLGTVTAGDLLVDGENWGQITTWQNIYDTAIEKYLSKETAADALSSL